MTDIFEGDPKIFIDADGAKIKFKDNQPIMDQGLENVITIAWFSGKDWFGNIFFEKASEKLGSNFEEEHNRPITLTNLSDCEKAAEQALSKDIESGLISAVVAKTESPRSNTRVTTAIIKPPGADLVAIEATKNGKNWENQAFKPAYINE